MKDLTGDNNLVGVTFGKFTVSGKHQTKLYVLWDCVCDCGRHCYFSGSRIMAEMKPSNPYVASCGNCRRFPPASECAIRRRMFQTWTTMKNRCHNPNSTAYKNYGERGIFVCEEWHNSFDSFYSYVSKLDHFNEPGRSLDRINNDDGYRPGNVRWATAKEQANNKRPRKKRGLSCEQRTNRSKAEGNQEI